VARVCRRWHRITSHASMWPTLDMKPQDSRMVAWLRQRSAGLQHLTLTVSTRCAAVATDADLLHGPDQVEEPPPWAMSCTKHIHRVVMPYSLEAPIST
jgi:hypothetical protein